jgi:rRNA maturation endonuclease Nob1
MPDDHRLPPKDHNQTSPQSERETVLNRVDDIVLNANRWKNERKEILTEDQAVKATDFLAQIRKCASNVEKLRKAEKEPILEKGRAIDEEYNGVKERLDRSKKAIQEKLTVWLERQQKLKDEEATRKAEEARKAADEAEALMRLSETDIDAGIAAENATKHAAALQKEAAKASGPARVSGEYAPRAASLRTNRSAEITDVMACAGHYRDTPALLECLAKLANADIRAAKGEEITIPGVTINETRSAV